MLDYFRIPLFQHAFIVALIAGAGLPLLGDFVVVENFTFSAAGLAHIAFAGVTLFLLLNLPPFWGGLIFAITAALFLWYAKEKKAIAHDVTMGILFSLFLALAVLFIKLSKRYSGEALGYLFGSILGITKLDMLYAIIIFLITLFVILYFYRDLYLIILNRELALAGGIRVSLISLVFLILLAVAIVISMKIMGALLVFGFIVIPSAAAFQLTFRFHRMLVLSSIFGVISAMAGFFPSLIFDFPPGPVIIITSFFIFLIALAFSKKH